MKYLAIFSDVVNDVEVSGFIIMDGRAVASYEKLAASIDWEFTYPIGDYEITYPNGDELLNMITFKEMTKEESFGVEMTFDEKFGTFVDESFLTNLVGDDNFNENYDEEDNNDYD